MAVVSISRIQVRRGTINQGTSLPQLASGEFGWAVDTQELYIGNGSTSEGAPAVGNTEILTVNSNILNLAEQYVYREDEIDSGEAGNVARTIAERLDDRVSVRAFGVTPDATSVADKLQKALYELYLKDGSTSSDTAPVLYVEEGTFVLDKTVYVPPFATIIGAGKDRTVFARSGEFPLFQTISSQSDYNGTLAGANPLPTPVVGTTGTQVSDQARNIKIQHCTLAGNDGTSGRTYLMSLRSCRNSEFKSVRMRSTGSTGISIAIPNWLCGIELTSQTNIVGANSNRFVDCDFFGLKEPVYGAFNVQTNTFDSCSFGFLDRGIVLGENLALGQSGPTGNIVLNSNFSNINKEAFLVPQGSGNKSRGNVYGRSVGNNAGSAATAAYPIVSYGERGNFSIDDTFERTYNLSMNSTYTRNVKYVPEVAGPLFYTNGGYQTTKLINGAFERTAFRLPADKTRMFEVEYFYTSELRDFTRTGQLQILVNVSLPGNETIEIADEFSASGDVANYVGQVSNIKFEAEIQYDDPSAKNEIWAADIRTSNNNDQGDLVIKITSKS